MSLIQEYNFQKKSLNNNTLRFLLLAFNTKLNELANDSNKPLLNSPTVVKSFFELLENNYTRERSVAFYISQLNITAKKLAQVLSQATGKTTLDLITERIILESKRELLFSKKSIKEIAFYLGFDDPLYFSKYIKKNTGQTPQHLRKDFAEISI
jgi:AraC-like DNA-binding protein